MWLKVLAGLGCGQMMQQGHTARRPSCPRRPPLSNPASRSWHLNHLKNRTQASLNSQERNSQGAGCLANSVPRSHASLQEMQEHGIAQGRLDYLPHALSRLFRTWNARCKHLGSSSAQIPILPKGAEASSPGRDRKSYESNRGLPTQKCLPGCWRMEGRHWASVRPSLKALSRS